jgi:hypothetical protein
MPKGEYTEDLFSVSQPVATEKVMGVLDSINGDGVGERFAWRVCQPILIGGCAGR